MKKLLCFLSLFICLTSCEKTVVDQPEKEEAHVNYYVQYQASIKSQYTSGVMQVQYVDEYGKWKTVDCSGKTYEVIIGPVYKDFKAQMKIIDLRSNGTCSSSINVCIGSEPFALKASGTTSCEYVIK